MSRSNRVAVTGGAGFIGSHYVRQILSGAYPEFADASVVVLDKLTYAGNEENLAPVSADRRFELVVGDVCDADLLADVLPGVDVVVHFAAESHVDRSITGPADFMHTNVQGTHTVLNACLDAGVRRVVQVSTDEVYGSIDAGSWTEDHPLEPNSPYSASKASADLVARSYFRTYGLPVCVTRCSNNYGRYQFPEKIIPLFITNLLEGEELPLYGDGSNVRDWLHVDDHCRAIQLVVEGGRPGDVYNIGGGTELTNRDLTAQLLKETGSDWSSVRHVPDRPGHDQRYSVDWTKIKNELGYTPRVDLADGLADTVRWYVENEAWWGPLRRTAPQRHTGPHSPTGVTA
ncbi:MULTISPECIES: dTDP-glucose 4,6-dehydratase [Streptomyces]|uniref:dTDP-glucose 4,6-dehydratase n=1 Tax=Streptomyces TaxID=1883 RepID=UPI0002AA48B4|nr:MULTISPECIES: dTDP-glucose 4,6-dehydratase [Streptomyces]AGC09479.1 LobD5 [Streptomyces sp. FXJ7.023]MBZ6086535.1 dTDP-glucose 4,6-dehydratase [Streptomyces olivaceus]MBZ6107926.1 dTDP-glucose 4,6-dehydratase [Streptomyces olivaceus]MBZ6114808.1 dTDP-glucose 4,6-dehydratase [Streptomyces olivaceus]MBZ6128781.1 dTDP-glucose 4,6-dehydratase [Streptomyces olivaceus]